MHADIRMPINNFILDRSQQSNYGIKGQFLPKHLLSEAYDMAQKEKQEGQSGTEYQSHGKQHTVLPVSILPHTHVKHILEGD